MPKNMTHRISQTSTPDACCLSSIKLIKIIIENINKKEQKAEDDNGLLYDREKYTTVLYYFHLEEEY